MNCRPAVLLFSVGVAAFALAVELPLCFGPSAPEPRLQRGALVADETIGVPSSCGRNCLGAYASPAAGRDTRRHFVPEECRLLRFAPTALPALLARLGGGVLFVGDSMSRQHYTAFSCALRDAGLRHVTYTNLTGGIVAIHSGIKM